MKPPPSPPHAPLMQRLRFMHDPIGYLEYCQRTLGDIFTLRLFKRGMVLVCSPELAKQIYLAPDDTLVAGQAKVAIFGKLLGSSSTLLLDGQEHVERRRLLLPRFRGEVLQAFVPVMARACNHTLDTLPLDKPFALHPYMHRIAFDVIAEALFSTTPKQQLDPLLETMREFANKAVTSRLLMFPALQRDLGPVSPWGRVMRVVARTRAAVLDEINRRRRSDTQADDLLGLVMAAQHEDGRPLAEVEIRDEILTMVAAGHETTAMALTWLCYAVFTRPAVVERLIDELADKREVEVDSCEYLDAVVRESLRFHSVVPNGSARVVKRPFRLGDYEISAGSVLSVAIHAIHRSAGVYERADEFWPERFLKSKFSPYEAVAFGGGSRRCLGMPFALLETKVVLAALLKRFSLEVVQTSVRPTWRGTFLTPSRGLRVRVHERRSRATAVAARA